MNEKNRFGLSWVFIALAVAGGVALYQGWQPLPLQTEGAAYSDPSGDNGLMPLPELVEQLKNEGFKVLEVEKETKHGRTVYEIEVLNSQGHVFERYHDAESGELIKSKRED